MKITKEHWRGGIEYNNIAQAVEEAAIATDESENKALRELVGRLVEVIFWQHTGRIDLTDTEKLEHILGYGYKVEE
jgi:hypothetical protein